MLDKLKQLKNLQSQAKNIKQELAQEKIEIEEQGLKVVMNGNQEVLEIQLNPDLSFKDNQQHLIELLNQAQDKVQQLMASKAKSMMNMPF